GMTVSEMRLVARINPKSDPTGIIAGDDTACCMPFGSGKNTVYTFNLNTGQFTLQLEREGNRPRTIAQSVLTKDRDSGKSVPELVSQILHGHKHITEVLGPEIMQEGTAVAACDNVEVAPNYMESRYLDAIKIIYTDFFRKYMARYGTEQNLETEKVVVGLGYSDALQNLKREPNTYVPLAPVSYSDKLGEMVGKLDLTTDTSAVRCDVREIMVGEARKNPAIEVCGVSYLTYEDTHSVSWLEGKAYQDNPGFIENFHNMENGLIAKDIANEHFDRPNMSLKYSQEGRVFGYLMAWEGKMNSSHSGEPVVYIADLAVEPGNRMAGGRLVHAFGDLYKENYIKNGHLPAIVGEFREDTSYKLVKKHLQKLTQRLGVEFEITELGTEQRNGERMHRLVIRPKAA
ncbi:MAG: hypothetical protein KDD70_10425, partial [Bdellovibrionales bacterium]|nr:hypothetical protein [Bdellovibrionales bacterium]